MDTRQLIYIKNQKDLSDFMDHAHGRYQFICIEGKLICNLNRERNNIINKIFTHLTQEGIFLLLAGGDLSQERSVHEAILGHVDDFELHAAYWKKGAAPNHSIIAARSGEFSEEQRAILAEIMHTKHIGLYEKRQVMVISRPGVEESAKCGFLNLFGLLSRRKSGRKEEAAAPLAVEMKPLH